MKRVVIGVFKCADCGVMERWVWYWRDGREIGYYCERHIPEVGVRLRMNNERIWHGKVPMFRPKQEGR